MAINFPNSPLENDLYSEGGTTWIYKSPSWNLYSGTGFVTTAQLSSNLSGYASSSALSAAIVQNRNIYNAAIPIANHVGQIWYDSTNSTIKVWSGTIWLNSSIHYSSAAPANPVSGTVWIDSVGPSFKVYDGVAWVSAGGSATDSDQNIIANQVFR
jgi:hypothetical protein